MHLVIVSVTPLGPAYFCNPFISGVPWVEKGRLDARQESRMPVFFCIPSGLQDHIIFMKQDTIILGRIVALVWVG